MGAAVASGDSQCQLKTRAADLRLEKLSKSYDGGRNVLDGIDLDVSAGELISLLGPSGCGKSTVLRLVAGLIPPSAGRILVAGRDITNAPAHARKMGLVFQNYALFPHLSVARNIAFGLEMRGVARADIARLVDDALTMVRLPGMRDRMPRQLSGGQQQRVALARALVIRPDLLLLDEPLSNLDANLREEMRNEIRDLQSRFGITTVFVTHDQSEALAMSDRVAVMQTGHIIQCATPIEIYERPASADVAAFIGRVNKLEGRIVRSEHNRVLVAVDGIGEIWAPGQLAPGSKATLMVRPHRVTIAPASSTPAAEKNRLKGTVVKSVYIGDQVQIVAQVGPTTLLAEFSSDLAGWQSLNARAPVTIEWSINDGFAFPGR